MHDNAGVLTKCIAVSSRHLDDISHPLCLALTRTMRATGENKSVLHKYLHDSRSSPGILSASSLNSLPRVRQQIITPYALIVNAIIM